MNTTLSFNPSSGCKDLPIRHRFESHLKCLLKLRLAGSFKLCAYGVYFTGEDPAWGLEVADAVPAAVL